MYILERGTTLYQGRVLRAPAAWGIDILLQNESLQLHFPALYDHLLCLPRPSPSSIPSFAYPLCLLSLLVTRCIRQPQHSPTHTLTSRHPAYAPWRPRSQNHRAMSYTWVWLLDPEAFTRVFNEFPEFSAPLRRLRHKWLLRRMVVRAAEQVIHKRRDSDPRTRQHTSTRAVFC